MIRNASFEVGGEGCLASQVGFAAYFFAGTVISVVSQHFASFAFDCTVAFVTAGSEPLSLSYCLGKLELLSSQHGSSPSAAGSRWSSAHLI